MQQPAPPPDGGGQPKLDARAQVIVTVVCVLLTLAIIVFIALVERNSPAF